MKRVAVLLLLAALARADDEKPLPLRKTVTLASGGKYFVEGRQEIRWGQELTVQKGTKIVGRGPGAILVVSGALQMHGVEGDEVAIEDMLILIDERCRQLQFDSVKVNRCVIRTPDKKTSMATLQFEECDLFRTTLELRLHKGEVTMLNCKVSGPIRIAAVARPGEKAAVKALFNTSNIDRDLVIQGLNSVVVRACSINGQPVSFLDCAVLTFDANVVKSGTIVFEQSKAGQFKKTKLQKSDFHDTRFVFQGAARGEEAGPHPDRQVLVRRPDQEGRDPQEVHRGRAFEGDDRCFRRLPEDQQARAGARRPDHQAALNRPLALNGQNRKPGLDLSPRSQGGGAVKRTRL